MLDGDKFVAQFFGLPLEFYLGPFLPLGVSGLPDSFVVFDLVLDHGVKDHCDFMRGCRDRRAWAQPGSSAITLHGPLLATTNFATKPPKCIPRSAAARGSFPSPSPFADARSQRSSTSPMRRRILWNRGSRRSASSLGSFFAICVSHPEWLSQAFSSQSSAESRSLRPT